MIKNAKDIKNLSDGLNEVLLFINGSPAPGGVSVIMSKDFAIAHARALLDAAQSLSPGQPNVAFALEGHLIPRNKTMTTNIDYSKEQEAGDESYDSVRNRDPWCGESRLGSVIGG